MAGAGELGLAPRSMRPCGMECLELGCGGRALIAELADRISLRVDTSSARCFAQDRDERPASAQAAIVAPGLTRKLAPTLGRLPVLGPSVTGAGTCAAVAPPERSKPVGVAGWPAAAVGLAVVFGASA